MNWITIILALVTCIDCSVISSINYLATNQNNENLINCVTSDQSLGFCVDRKECNSNDNSFNSVEEFDPNNCPKEEQVCCNQFNITRLHMLWPAIHSIWSAWPTLPPRPTWPTYASRPIWNWSPFPTSATPSPTTTSNTARPHSTIQCGRRNLSNDVGYIVGGQEAAAHSWPWAVAVYIGSGPSLANYRFVCGASLISSQYVLGAAHCVSHSGRITKPEHIGLLIGAHDRRYEGRHFTVDKVLVHSKYDERLMQNDIALYHLSEPIDFAQDEDIAPVCLPTPEMDGRDLSRQMAYLVGWGTTTAGGKTSDHLRQVQVPIIPNQDCAKSYNSLMITSKQLCAGYAFGQRDSCQVCIEQRDELLGSKLSLEGRLRRTDDHQS